MTIDADSLAKLLDRFGLPTVYLAVIAYLFYLFIKGPLMRLAERFGDGFAALAKAGVEYLQGMTASLARTHVEHEQIKSHVSTSMADVKASVDAVKATVAAESAATREHVSTKVEGLRDRVSSAEASIEGTVRQATGEHAAVSAARIPPAAPTLPERGGA